MALYVFDMQEMVNEQYYLLSAENWCNEIQVENCFPIRRSFTGLLVDRHRPEYILLTCKKTQTNISRSTVSLNGTIRTASQ